MHPEVEETRNRPGTDPFTNVGEDYSPIGLQAAGSRLRMAVIRDGALWTCHHIGLDTTNGTYTGDASGTSVDRSGAQWLKISTDTNGNFLSLTNGRVYDPASANPFWYYFPSLMVNRVDDMVMAFSGSHSNTFIGTFWTYRRADGTTPAAPFTLNAGQGRYKDSGAWGDYSYTTLDPIDRLTFWTVQQYADDEIARPRNHWGNHSKYPSSVMIKKSQFMKTFICVLMLLTAQAFPQGRVVFQNDAFTRLTTNDLQGNMGSQAARMHIASAFTSLRPGPAIRRASA